MKAKENVKSEMHNLEVRNTENKGIEILPGPGNLFRFPKMIFLVAVAAILSLACEKTPPPVDEELLRQGLEAEVSRDVEILYSDSAQIKVRVTGPTMLYFQDRTDLRQEFPDGLKVEFFDERQQISSVLTAKYGVRLETQDKVVVRDSVVWKSTAGDMLETSELTWNERQKNVYTNRFVVVTRPDEIMYGHGFEADQNFRDIRMYTIDGKKKIEKISEDLE